MITDDRNLHRKAGARVQRMPIEVTLHPIYCTPVTLATGGSEIPATPPGAAACLRRYWDATNKMAVCCILNIGLPPATEDRKAAAVYYLEKDGACAWVGGS